MFSSPAPGSSAFQELFDTHAGLYARSVQQVMEAGESAMEQHVDALRTLFATTTVATRQWLGAGSVYDWLTPVPLPAAPVVPDLVKAA